MARKGYNSVVVYLDDFLVIGESQEACQMALNAILSLLQNLGFRINWSKAIYSAPQLIFLGVTIDTFQGTEDKLEALQFFWLEFSLHKRASRRQLKVLAGKLTLLLKNGMTRNQLKPPETTRNQLKPPETTRNQPFPPETGRNETFPH